MNRIRKFTPTGGDHSWASYSMSYLLGSHMNRIRKFTPIRGDTRGIIFEDHIMLSCDFRT